MVTVFTNSQAAITKILDLKTKVGRDTVRNLVYQNTHIIKNTRYTIVLQWVSGHSKIPENEKANAVAKDVVYKEEK